MDINEIFRPRYGLADDPNWGKYHQWPWDYFPVVLPACTILRRQSASARPDLGVISWEVERGVPVVSRFDGEAGNVLVEVLPEPASGRSVAAGERDYLLRSDGFGADVLRGLMGFAFEWVFEAPVKPAGTLQPSHRLGVVRVEASALLGKETTITVRAGGRVK
jgi:hypothetical protein